MLMNIGSDFRLSENKLITTMAWRIHGVPTYALEGSVFTGGAAVQWLRDEMHLISTAAESEEAAASIDSTGGVYLVPAFTGLGAPHWNMYARGMLVGMTRGTGRAHIIRAALESIVYQSADLLRSMAEDYGRMPDSLRADGGASANNFLMQFQSDISGLPVIRPGVQETTALGAALLAGLAAGIYSSLEDTTKGWHEEKAFYPSMDGLNRDTLIAGWQHAVDSCLYRAGKG